MRMRPLELRYVASNLVSVSKSDAIPVSKSDAIPGSSPMLASLTTKRRRWFSGGAGAVKQKPDICMQEGLGRRRQQGATKVGHFILAWKSRRRMAILFNLCWCIFAVAIVSDPIFRKFLGMLGKSPWLALNVGDVTRQLPRLGPRMLRTRYAVENLR